MALWLAIATEPPTTFDWPIDVLGSAEQCTEEHLYFDEHWYSEERLEELWDRLGDFA